MKKMLFAVLLLALVVPSVSFAADLYSDANYAKNCAMCHGKTAEAKPMGKIQPMKAYASKSKDELAGVINNGKADAMPKMKGYKGTLTDAQIATLVSEIKALK